MCFTQPVSIAFAVSMWAFAAVWKGPNAARACIAYFAAMETLQAFQYSWINQCDDQINKFLTILGFLHLAFQPFFANLYLSAYMNRKQKRYVPVILAISLFAGVLMCNRMWKSEGDLACTYGVEPMCGLQTCSFRGNVHIAWQMPLQHADQDYFTPGFNLHFFTFYLPTFALGMWPLTLFLLFSGPFLGRVLTSHQDEIPAIWCFFSIAQLFFPLVWAYITKTAMFAPKSAANKKDDDAELVHANGNGKANGNGHHKSAAEEDDCPEPIPDLKTSVIRAVQLFAALTLKRYATIALNAPATA